MNRVRRLTAMIVVALFLTAACGPEGAEPGEDSGHGHDHTREAPPAPHGGDVIVLGESEAYIEVLVEHDNGIIRLWIYDGSMTEATPDAPPLLSYAALSAVEQIAGRGTGGVWMFEHPVIREEGVQVRFRVAVGGRSYSPLLEHGHGE